MDNVYICRFTIDFTLKPTECCNFNSGVCDVDGEKCNGTLYIPAPDAEPAITRIISQIKNAKCALEVGDAGSAMAALDKAERLWAETLPPNSP